MTVVGLDHAQVCIPAGEDARAACVAFWAGVLGLVEVPKPKALALRGGAWFAAAPGAPAILHVGVEHPFRPNRKAHPALVVAAGSLDALADRLAQAGHDVRWDAEVPGVRRLHTDDPAGNRVELVEATGLPEGAGPGAP